MIENEYKHTNNIKGLNYSIRQLLSIYYLIYVIFKIVFVLNVLFTMFLTVTVLSLCFIRECLRVGKSYSCMS